MKPALVAPDEQGRGVGEGVKEGVEPVAVGFGEVAQDVRRHPVLVARMADAEAHAGEVLGTEAGVDRAQAVVPRRAAAVLHPHPGGGEVEFVVEDEDVLGRNFMKAGGLGHRRPPGLVHVGLRRQEHRPSAAQVPPR